ncbi:hypothetical protein QQZ08_009421 [Neonectria magnoliae]|uniref:Uncharacterized protein n=1 Tax=Neonectria magnoliae TaxID=2732573 RepID=A0ABR1HP30_9HYPO
MAILAFFISCLVKKRQDAPEDDDPKSFVNFMTKTKGAKKRKMSDLDKVDGDDIQRQIMIRKSLASRASSRTTTTTRKSKGKGPLEAEGMDDDDDTEKLDNERISDSLKTDWKAYEADLQRNRSVLIRRHPGVDRSNIDGSVTTPLSPLSPISPTSPTSPTSPMSSISSPPPMSLTSPRTTSQNPRHHYFPVIQRKPLSPTARISESPASPGVGRAPKLE